MRCCGLSCALLLLVLPVAVALSQEPERENEIVRSSAGHYDVRVKNAPLAEVLDSIRAGSSVAITASPRAVEQVVSAEFRNASIEETLRTLLQGQDAFYMYAAEGQKPAVLKAVWVYCRGEAKAMEPAAPEALKASKDLELSLMDSDPAVRMRAFNTLVGRVGNDARNALISAVLQERDDSIRGGMVEAMRATGSDLPSELISTLLNDPCEQIRLLTLDSLRGSPNVRDLATAALADSSPHVRIRAQELLDESDESGRKPPEPTPAPR